MQQILLKSAKVICPTSAFHNKIVDIYIENGIIKSIGKKVSVGKQTKVVEATNLHVSMGWLDLRCNVNDPGFEHKEEVATITKAAIQGGFTGIVATASTSPITQTKAQIEYLKNKAEKTAIDIFPTGALTQNMEGKDITEMYDMHLSGAVAFSDNKKSVANAGTLLRAIEYAKNFDGVIMHFADDTSISMGGKMNEGITNLSLGLKGIPSLAEEITISRDIFITEYTGGKIHLASVSSEKSVERIKGAKAKKHKITADVAAHQLLLDETALASFDTNYKVNPPLRTQKDIEALISGINNGSIDAICSDHTPQDIDSKQKEFDHAAFGIIGLETAFSAANTALYKKVVLDKIIECLTTNPRAIVNIAIPEIKEGAVANLTLFNPSQKWVFSADHIQSKSKNTPFIGHSFVGKAVGIVNKGNLHLAK